MSLPSSLSLQGILASLFASLSGLTSDLDTSPQQRAIVKREAILLRNVVGPLKAEREELWECVSALILGREWSESHGRIFVCWISGGDKDNVDVEGMTISFSCCFRA